MDKLETLKPERVFHYFKEISAIPRGSGNRVQISDYCVDFAKAHQLEYIQDAAHNVIIFKPASAGYEDSLPMILQGHLDMVCQKTPEKEIDFEAEGIHLVVEGDYLTADGTTLGADNGIAVAMMLAILESDTASHPPIEAIFTTDEEIGMLGAKELPFDKIKGKRMINIDAEEPDTVTVSCAGGTDVILKIPYGRIQMAGTRISVEVKGLKGGHSGIEINEGRVNADILAGRILHFINRNTELGLLSVDGGDKANAIPLFAKIEFVVPDAEAFLPTLDRFLEELRLELADREEGFAPELTVMEDGSFSVLDEISKDKVITALLTVPNGVMEMSCVIDDLVETSLNLGILQTEEDVVRLHFALRSSKNSAMKFLEERVKLIGRNLNAQIETGGYYPPWELNPASTLQQIYHQAYREQFGTDAKTMAIHAGLECAVFVANIEGLDCIAIGPELVDVHTVQERLTISSVEETYQLILRMLEKSK